MRNLLFSLFVWWCGISGCLAGFGGQVTGNVTHILVKNGWTNSIVLQYVDTNGTPVSMVVPVGGSFTAVADMGNPNLVGVLDPGSWDTNSGSFDFSQYTAGDGSTNDFVLEVMAVPNVNLNPPAPSTMFFLMQLVQYQYPEALADCAPAVSGKVGIAGLDMPQSWHCFHAWICGVTCAILLGLSGASRRFLGRVHEVNTDL